MPLIGPTSAVKIVSRAFVLLGERPISSFEESSARALAANELYEEVKRDALATYPWSFALREVQPAAVVPQTTDFTDSYQYTYHVPNNVIRVLGLQSGAPYRVVGDEIWTGDAAPQILYIENVGAEWFPPWFATALAYELAAQFAVALTEDSNKYVIRRNEADRKWPEARRQDAMQHSALRVRYDHLLRAALTPRIYYGGAENIF